MSLERREVLVYELKNITERIVKLQIYLSSDDNKDSEMEKILDEELQVLKNYQEIISSKIILLMKKK